MLFSTSKNCGPKSLFLTAPFLQLTYTSCSVRSTYSSAATYSLFRYTLSTSCCFLLRHSEILHLFSVLTEVVVRTFSFLLLLQRIVSKFCPLLCSRPLTWQLYKPILRVFSQRFSVSTFQNSQSYARVPLQWSMFHL